ncbi:amidohydrolase family protein [Costertonia aggregata]|uniref:Amidohydrolase family protein n=1 Tax=Costertonia aggregata TaxID=343403 RepID=A0A7H9AKM7_9FLAO|nr:amidohydrolase family protein [Costertonia aggregata]QLG43988.1 amidohydrolase family protein [Costertonia aggregata]
MQKTLCLLLLLCFGCHEPVRDKFDLVIANGNIIDLETGKISVEDIFISNGRIKRIERKDDSFLYDTNQTIDATGKYVLPGFWDNHVHFRGGDSLISANKNFLKLYIANGVTTVRDAGGDLTASLMQWKAEIAKGSLIGPNIFTSGPKIDGPAATWAGSLEVENELDIENALDVLQRIPSDYVKLYDSRISGENYLKTIQAAETRGLITSGHMPFTVTLDETVDAGIDAIEHLYYVMKGCAADEKRVTAKLKNKEIGFWQAMPLLMKSYADSTAQRTFTKLKENKVYVVPTLHIGKILSYLDETDHTDDPYLKYMGKGIIKTYQGRINGALNASKKVRADRKNLDAFFGKLAKSLNDSEVGLLAGSDSGAFNSYTYPGVSLHEELKQMVANGISPLDALRASAPNGADFLKQDADYGILSVGKISDLVLLDANPLEDIANTKSIHTVVKGNTIINKDKLNELLNTAIQN